MEWEWRAGHTKKSERFTMKREFIWLLKLTLWNSWWKCPLALPFRVQLQRWYTFGPGKRFIFMKIKKLFWKSFHIVLWNLLYKGSFIFKILLNQSMKNQGKDCLFPRAQSHSLVQHQGKCINSFQPPGSYSNWFPRGEGPRQNWPD